jgi:hypothetical protein
MNMRRPAYPITCLVMLAIVVFAPGTKAKSDCVKVKSEAQGQAISLNMFRLSVTGDLTATSTATLLEQGVTEDGTIQATTSHVFEINGNGDGICEAGEDCFTTLDRAILSPIDTLGLFSLNSHLAVISGHGVYANACGKLVAHGFINFGVGPPTLEWRLSGRICDCA